MRLGFILLDSVSDVNNFREVNELSLTEGNPGTLYFRIVQLDRSSDEEEQPLRLIPPIGATALVGFDSINDANDLTDLVASQPFAADDRSIWSIPILAGYKIGPNSMSVKLTYGGNTYILEAVTELRQSPTGNNRFFC